MTPRRSPSAPTDESQLPHWRVTYDIYRRVLAIEQLEIGTDPHAAMHHAVAKHKANGWAIENDGADRFFFCNRGEERRPLRIQPTDPSESVPLNNTSRVPALR
jgi:hypothetical protein